MDDIDLFTGGVSEKPLPGARVGPLFACIIGLQFKGLKYGDRFYYENDVNNVKFTPEQLNEIRKTLMANVICRNTDINKIHRNVFEKKSIRYVNLAYAYSIDVLYRPLNHYGINQPVYFLFFFYSTPEFSCSSFQNDIDFTKWNSCIPVNGGWSSWRQIGCTFRRTCNNPSPNKCGKPCSGRSYRVECAPPFDLTSRLTSRSFIWNSQEISVGYLVVFYSLRIF